MTIEKQASINQIEIVEDGTLQIRCGLMLVEDGAIISNKWHRTCIEPGQAVAAQIAAVNDHLAELGWPPVTDFARAQAVAAAVHTPEVVKAYSDKVLAAYEAIRLAGETVEPVKE